MQNRHRHDEVQARLANSRKALTRLNIVAFTAMPSANVSTATPVNPGLSIQDSDGQPQVLREDFQAYTSPKRSEGTEVAGQEFLGPAS
jgi:hypothetical protein